MKILLPIFLFSTLMSVSRCSGQTNYLRQSNKPLSPVEFRRLAGRCAPTIPLVTLRAIVRVESGFRPYALSLDYPQRTARDEGFANAVILLAHQPANLGEAQAWAHWLLKQHRTISIGLAQVSTQHAASLGITADQLFDPCTNIKAAARLLVQKYRAAVATVGEGQAALDRALSEYNSGSAALGFENGYLNRVIDGEFYPP